MINRLDFSYSINPAFLLPTPSLPSKVQTVISYTLPLLNAYTPTRNLFSYVFLLVHSKDLIKELIDLVFARKDWNDLKPAMQKTAAAVCRLALSLRFPYLYLVGSEAYDLSLRFGQLIRGEGIQAKIASMGGIMMQFLYLFSLLGDSPEWKRVSDQFIRGDYEKTPENEKTMLEIVSVVEATLVILEKIRILPLLFRNFPNILDGDSRPTPFQIGISFIVLIGRCDQAYAYFQKTGHQPAFLEYVANLAKKDLIDQIKDLIDQIKDFYETALPFIMYFRGLLSLALSIPEIFHKLKGFNYHVGATGKPVNMDDVVGCEDAKQSILKVIDQVKNPTKYTELGLTSSIKGMLFFGPPGTGKSMLARAFATEVGNATFLEQPGSSFNQIFVGMGAQNIRTLFGEATRLANQDTQRLIVIFIDEINRIGEKRSSGGAGWEREFSGTTEAFLVEMDKLPLNVIVIGACNIHPKELDEAFSRSGRFDQHIEFKLPTEKQRLETLTKLGKQYKVDGDVNEAFWKKIIKETDRWDYPDFDNLMKQAALDAGFHNHTTIKKSTIQSSLNKLKEQKSQGSSGNWQAMFS